MWIGIFPKNFGFPFFFFSPKQILPKKKLVFKQPLSKNVVSIVSKWYQSRIDYILLIAYYSFEILVYYLPIQRKIIQVCRLLDDKSINLNLLNNKLSFFKWC